MTIHSPNATDQRNKFPHGETMMDSQNQTSECSALIEDQMTHTYLRRWYVLFVFSLSCLLQGFALGTYGPISQSLKKAFGWSTNTIALLCMWNNLAFALFTWPLGKFLEWGGMRWTAVLSTALLAFALGLRCASSDPITATWLNNISQVIAGAASVFPESGCALLSSLWFPANQRTTATGISTFMGFLGVALAFVLGPLVVPERDLSRNETYNLSLYTNTISASSAPIKSTSSAKTISVGRVFSKSEVGRGKMVLTSFRAFYTTDALSERKAIMVFFYYVAGFSASVLLVTIIYFPAKPPLLPSISAGVKRLDLTEGITSLLRNIQFCLILSIFASSGIYLGFTQILDINLKALDVSQKTAGWLGFYTLIGGCLFSFVLSRISDMIPRKMKLLLLLMFVPSTAMLFWFLLIIQEFISSDLPSLYATVLVPGCFIKACQPLFYELACEAAYPTGEDVTTFMMTTAQNLIAAIILAGLIVPGFSVSCMNWIMATSISLSLILLFYVKEDYNRRRVDDKDDTVLPQTNSAGTPERR